MIAPCRIAHCNLRSIENYLCGRRYALIVIFLALAAFFLRLLRLPVNPGVYPDEANYIEISWNLIHGNFAWGMFSHSFLPRLPFPLAMMGLAQMILGRDLYAIRFVTVLFGILAVPLLAFLFPNRRMRPVMLIAALLFIYHPFVAGYQRWGMTYNFLVPLALAALALRFRLRRTQAPWMGGALAGVTALLLLTEPLGAAIAFCVWASLLHRRKRQLLWILPLSLFPLALYIAYLFARIPQIASADIADIFFNRLDVEGATPSVVVVASALYRALGIWLPLGTFGLLLCPRMYRGLLWLAYLLVLGLMVAVSGADYSLVLREAVVAAPFICIGAAFVLVRLLQWAARALSGEIARAARRWGRQEPAGAIHRGVLIAAIGVSGAFCVISPLQSALTVHRSPLDYIAARDAQALREASAYLARHTTPRDVVLASPVYESLPARTYSLMQFAVAQGARGNPFFPRTYVPGRLIASADLGDVRYILITDYTVDIEADYPGVASVLQAVRQWPVELGLGTTAVLRNPSSVND